LWLFLSVECAAATLFVSNQGDDGHSATISRPLKTIAEAADRAQPGDSVFIRGGHYRERIAPPRSGLPGKPITYSRYQDEPVVIDASGKKQGVILWGVSHIVIRGLQIKNSNRAGVHIHHHHDSPSRGSDHNRIENNDISGNGSHGIYVAGSHNLLVNNTIRTNGSQRGVKPKGHGIYVLGEENQVRKNKVEGNQRLGIRMAGERHQIMNNQVSGNGQHGIGVWVDPPYRGDMIEIMDNHLVNNGGDEIHINGAGKGGKPKRLRLVGNRIASKRGDGVVLLNGVSQVEVSGNHFTGTFGNFVQVGARSGEGLSSFNNHYSGVGRFHFLGRGYSQLSDFQRHSGMEDGSVYEY